MLANKISIYLSTNRLYTPSAMLSKGKAILNETSCAGGRHNIPRPCKLNLEKCMVSESCVTLATSVPILVFLGLSVLDLGPMSQTDVRRASSLNAPTLGRGRGHNNAELSQTLC